GLPGSIRRPERRGHRDRVQFRRHRPHGGPRHRRLDRAGVCPRRPLASRMTRGSDRADPALRIVGLGTDLVEIPRFRLAMERRGELLGLRLFSDDERAYAYRQKDPAKSLAVRFGAKEAVMKAMG